MSQCRQINFWIDQEENKVFVRLIMKTWLKKKKLEGVLCGTRDVSFFGSLPHQIKSSSHVPLSLIFLLMKPPSKPRPVF